MGLDVSLARPPGTSFSTLRVDGADNIYGSSGTLLEAPHNINATTNRSKWQIGAIETTQIIEIVNNPQTRQDDVAKVSYTLRNTGTVTHSVGLRGMFDTEINYNDGAPFRVPGIGIVTTEREFTGSDVPDTFQAFFNVMDNTHVAVSTLRSAGATPPDRLVLANWPRISGADYDYTVSPGLNFTSDSAYAVYWNPAALAPGGSRTYVTFYGLAELQVDLQPPLALGISAPAALSLVNGQYSPNPFDVTATVFNNGNGTASNVNLTLNLPAGLSLAAGTLTQSVGNLPAGQERQVSWSVSAASQPSEATLTFSVTAAAANAQTKTVQRQITLGAVVTPLIFIPGGGGSRLDRVGTPNLNIFPNLIIDAALEQNLSLDPNRPGANIIATDAIRTVLGEDIYASLLNMLRDRGSYREYQVAGDPRRRTVAGCDLSQRSNNPNLFVFAYDWRLGIAENAALLREYVGCVQQFYPGTEVDILTHSMGGLLARRYILNNDTHNVDKLITIAAPWLGAPKTINVLGTG